MSARPPGPTLDQSVSGAAGASGGALASRSEREFIRIEIVMRGIHVGGGAEILALQRFVEPALFRGRLGRRFALGPLGVLAFEQRVLLEFGFDVFREFQIGKLQQLDRLLQLRRHDQGLALSQLQTLCQRHVPPRPRYSEKRSPR